MAMSWARRLQRVLRVEIDTWVRCGETLRIIASIEPPEVTATTLARLQRTAPQRYQIALPLGARAQSVQLRLR